MSDQSNSLDGMSIDEVVERIERGELEPGLALELEKQGKNRKTLIGILEKMTETSPRVPETMKVVFVVNTKHNKTFYKANQKAEVSQEEFNVLLAAGVVRQIEG